MAKYRAFLPLAGDEFHAVILLLQEACRELREANPAELPGAANRAHHFITRAWSRLADPKNFHKTIVADVDG